MFKRSKKGISAAMIFCMMITSGALAIPAQAAEISVEQSYSGSTQDFSYMGAIGTLTADEVAEIAQKLYDALKAGQTNITLSGEKVKANFKYIYQNIYREVVNNYDVGLFVNKSAGLSGISSQGNNVYFTVTYYNVSDSDKQTYVNQLEKIKSGINENMTTVDKALYFYSYLATHYDYDIRAYSQTEYENANHDVFGFLRDKVGVCDAYASIYSFLMNSVGENAVKVVSDVDNHAWNLVKVGEQWYYVDVTHGDSVHGNHPGLLSYGYFLLSRDDHKTARSTSTSTSSWEESNWGTYMGSLSDMTEISIAQTDSIQGFWENSGAAVYPWNTDEGTWVVCTSPSYGKFAIEEYDLNKKVSTIKNINESYYWTSSGEYSGQYYLGGKFMAIVPYEDVVFYTTPTAIHAVYEDQDTVVYTADDATGGKMITGMKEEDGFLTYTVSTWQVSQNNMADSYTIYDWNIAQKANSLRGLATVSIVCDESTDNYAVKIGDKLDMSKITRDGYILDGLYTDYNFTNQFDVNTAISGDTELFAKWTKAYTVTVDGEAMTVKEGDTIGLEQLDSDNKMFAGWFIDGDTSKRFDPTTPITEDLVIESKFGDVQLYGGQVSLGDEIEFMTWLAIENDLLDDELDLRFTAESDSVSEDEISVSAEFANEFYKEGYTVALVTVKLPARHMDKDISVTVSSAYGDSLTFNCGSVNDNLDTIMTKTQEDETFVYSESARELAQAVKTYGTHAAYYFDGVGEPNDVSDVVIDNDAGQYTSRVSGTVPTGLNYMGSTLLLESNTKVRHYFTVQSGYSIDQYTFAFDDVVTEVKSKTLGDNTYYYVEYYGIDAENLADMYTISVNKTGDAGSLYQIDYSPLCYANDVVSRSSITDTKLKNLMLALYNYYDKAIIYNDENSGGNVIG